MIYRGALRRALKTKIAPLLQDLFVKPTTKRRGERVHDLVVGLLDLLDYAGGFPEEKADKLLQNIETAYKGNARQKEILKLLKLCEERVKIHVELPWYPVGVLPVRPSKRRSVSQEAKDKARETRETRKKERENELAERVARLTGWN